MNNLVYLQGAKLEIRPGGCESLCPLGSVGCHQLCRSTAWGSSSNRKRIIEDWLRACGLGRNLERPPVQNCHSIWRQTLKLYNNSTFYHFTIIVPKGNLVVLWLDHANDYESVPYKLVEESLHWHHVPSTINNTILHYYNSQSEVKDTFLRATWMTQLLTTTYAVTLNLWWSKLNMLDCLVVSRLQFISTTFFPGFCGPHYCMKSQWQLWKLWRRRSADTCKRSLVSQT